MRLHVATILTGENVSMPPLQKVGTPLEAIRIAFFSPFDLGMIQATGMALMASRASPTLKACKRRDRRKGQPPCRISMSGLGMVRSACSARILVIAQLRAEEKH